MSSPDHPRGRPAVLRNVAVVLAAALGVGLVIATKFREPIMTASAWIAMGVWIALLCVGPLMRRVVRTIDALRQLSPARRIHAAFIAGVSATLALLGLRWAGGLPFGRVWHDEFQFHLQSQMLARLRLRMPPHELADAFDTFYVLTRPVYAPQSFPGAAMLFTPTVWFDLPTWVMPALVTAAVIGLIWWLIADVVDPAAATVATVVVASLEGMRKLVTMYMAQLPLVMLGLIALVAAVRWQRTGKLGWAALAGVALGWAAITRPLDAACFGAIAAVVMLTRVARHAGKIRSYAGPALAIVCAAPLLSVQLVFNHGVTGSWTKTPFQFYNERDQPALAYSTITATNHALPQTVVPQKQDFYRRFTLRFVGLHNDPTVGTIDRWKDRVAKMRSLLAPTMPLMIFAVIGAAGLVTARRWVLASLLPLFMLGYQFYPIFLFHYASMALPAVSLLYGLAPNVIAAALGGHRPLRVEAAVVLLIACWCVAGLVDHQMSAGPEPADAEARYVREIIAKHVRAPAIVMFQWSPAPNEATPPVPYYEPVYNDDVAWPDDAPIVRAHDLGQEQANRLVQYYAKRQPYRTLWVYDRITGQLAQLGRVNDLAAASTQPSR